MECSCIYVDRDGSIDDVWFEPRYPKANKTHRCCECGRRIEKGENYTYESGIWEGSCMAFKTCSDCISIRKAFFCQGWVYGMMTEYLKEHIKDAGGQIQSSCIVGLTDKAKDIVFNIIEEVWAREDEWDGFIRERTLE